MERTYTTRDNATRALRKLGVGKAEYDKFLRRLDDGKFAIVQETATEQATSDVVGDVEEPEERPIVPFNGSDVAALSTKPLRMDPVEDYDSKANASFKPKPKAAKPKAAKPKAAKPKAAKPKAAKPKAAKPKAAKPKAAKPKVSGELTVASEARRLILEGLDNAAVFKKLQAMFKVGDEKRNYPSWYRCQLRRQGRIK